MEEWDNVQPSHSTSAAEQMKTPSPAGPAGFGFPSIQSMEQIYIALKSR